MFYGEIENTPEAVKTLTGRITADGQPELFCYEGVRAAMAYTTN